MNACDHLAQGAVGEAGDQMVGGALGVELEGRRPGADAIVTSLPDTLMPYICRAAALGEPPLRA
ncbi:hypothetical protein [Streptomyces sp. NPDC003996]